MIFCASLKTRGIPLVAHGVWGVPAKRDALWICSSQSQLQTCIDNPACGGIRDLESLVYELPEKPAQDMVEITGATVGRLGRLIQDLKDHGDELRPLHEILDLTVLDPRRGTPAGEGVIAWAHARLNFHAVIVRTKQQARNVAEGLVSSGLSSDGFRELCERIDRWSIVDSSTNFNHRIDGLAAKLLKFACLCEAA